MNSIKRGVLEPCNMNKSKRHLKNLLALFLIVSAFTMLYPSSIFSVINPVAAATLANVTVIPTNDIVNTRTTYDIFFNTATTGLIKTIRITFPSGFEVSSSTVLLVRSGIGQGLLSASSSSTLIYTVSNPVIVAAGTTIKLEIGRIINSNTAGIFRVGISTADTVPTVIDGPTLSWSFKIREITGNDVSPNFMIRKTLNDDAAGHAHGWDPDASTTSYAIFDSDIIGASDAEFVSVMIRNGNAVYCSATTADTGLFHVQCNSAPGNSAILDYIITKLPAHVVTSTSISSKSSPFGSLQTGH